MNTAGSSQYEARWILTVAPGSAIACPPSPVPLLLDPCSFLLPFAGLAGNNVLYEVRNGASDPFVGPLGEGAGKLNVPRALAALRDGVVVYSAASGSGEDAGTGPRDLQGAGRSARSARVSRGRRASSCTPHRASPRACGSSTRPDARRTARLRCPRRGSSCRAARRAFARAETRPSSFTLSVPSSAPAGTYTGTVVVRVANGQVLQVPVFASVAMHDLNTAAGNPPGPQARITSARDVYGKTDTLWPSVIGSAGTGAGSDWLVYPVELGAAAHRRAAQRPRRGRERRHLRPVRLRRLVRPAREHAPVRRARRD